MAIGTKVKVGWDASAVKTGMMKLKSGFAGVGRILGRGLKAGAVLGGVGAITAIGAALKAAMGVKDLADYGSGLSDMAVQTGVAVDKLVLMEEAMRLAGVPMRDTSRALSTLAANIQEAQSQAGLARDAFNDIGIYMDQLEGKRIDEVFDMIGRAIADSGGEIKNLERSMEGLFGARIGYGLLRLFRDPANFEKAAKNVGNLARDLKDSANDLDRLADDLGGLGVQMRGFYLGLYRVAKQALGDNPLQPLFDAFNYENMRPVFERIRNTFVRMREEGIGAIMGDMMEQMTALMKSLGAAFGEGIKESLRGNFSILDAVNPTWALPKMFGIGKDKSGDETAKNTRRTNEILENINRRDSVAVFA